MANWGKILSRGHVEDRRSLSPAIGGISLTGLALYFLFTYLSGGNIYDALGQLQNLPIQTPSNVTTQEFEGEDAYEVFASTVLGSNNDTWSHIFSQNGTTYDPPRLVLFRTATDSACGTASSEVGPHYCPLDQTIYLDETFFEELTTRLGAQGGDVAEAYVIAHEVGHHVQQELGIMQSAQRTQQRDQSQANQISIKLELQADCFAGIWANSIKDRDVFLPNEISEAMDAAASVGDDRIQQKSLGYSNPETWTHGSAQQRLAAFNQGYASGDLSSCPL